MNFSDVNTCYPAKILEFDPTTQTAKVQLCIESYYDTVEKLSNKVVPSTILFVPVHFPQCGTYALTFPIQVGDDCLVFFAQRGYDHWLYEGKGEAGLSYDGLATPQHNRMFAETDALALVGFNPVPEVIPNFSSTNVELRNIPRTQFVSLDPSGDAEITTPNTLTVNATSVVVNASTATINAPDTTVNGNTTLNGTLLVTERATFQSGFDSINGSGGISSVDGDMRIGGIGFLGHVHVEQGDGQPTSTPQ